MACRHEEIEFLEEDKEKIKTAIEKLVAALDKSESVGYECECIDSANKKTFRTINMMKLSNNLIQLNDDGNSAIASTIARLTAALAELEMLLSAYRIEDAWYHAMHRGENDKTA